MSVAQITPHGASRIWVEISGARWAALRAEPVTPRGAVAVLVPGFTGSKEDFAPLIDPLCDAGLSVLALDLPGQYESPGPDREQDVYPDPLGRALATLMVELATAGDRVLLMGHSYGGLVARAAMLAGAPVAGLTLLDSGPGALAPGWRTTMMEALEPVLRSGGTGAVQEVLEARDGVAEPAELAALLRTRFLRSSATGLLGMGTALRTEPDRVSELATILSAGAIPCLVVFGESDDAWPLEALHEMAARLGAGLAVIPHAAHSPNTENPAALVKVLLPRWQQWLAATR
ncbi:MAG TPA: alpha/beta fold hydrolase [Pseudonocardiaceae bacterium]